MRNRQKLLSFFIIIFSFLILILLTANSFIRQYIDYKLEHYFPGFKISYFDYSLNNTFSLIVKNQKNKIKIYGQIYPLSALFDANINNISVFNSKLNGKMQVKGKIIYKDKKYKAHGIAYFADGYLTFDMDLGKNIIFKGRGEDFNNQKLLKMLRFYYPYIKGTSKLEIVKNKKLNIIVNTRGIYKNKIKTELKARTKISINHNVTFDTKIKSPLSDIHAIGSYNRVLSIKKFKVSNINLLYLKPYLLYPFRSEVNISGSYDGANDILKFSGNDFQGFKTDHIEIAFNLKSKKFFKYIGLNDILRGNISGVIKIKDDKGNFDIVSSNNVFLTTDFTKKIYRLTGINLKNYKFKNIFIKGNFNSNALVFNLFSNNSTITINIKQGEFTYPNHYKIVFEIKQINKFFKILIQNNHYKILEKSNIMNDVGKILVY